MKINFKDYLPLIYVYILTVILSFSIGLFFSYNYKEIVFTFLGVFSIIFASLKIIRLEDFVEAFSEYDFITQKLKIYGYAFPFFEFIFGVSFLLLVDNLLIEVLCLGLFILNSYSVIKALKKNKKFYCACLGDLIKVPLSYVSLFENLTMILGVIYLILN